MVPDIKFLSKDGPSNEGGDRVRTMVGSVAFDDSYPTNGEALDLTEWFNSVLLVVIESVGGYTFQYVYADKKVKVFYDDADLGADGPHIEVANTTDLSGLTDVRFVAYGL